MADIIIILSSHLPSSPFSIPHPFLLPPFSLFYSLIPNFLGAPPMAQHFTPNKYTHPPRKNPSYHPLIWQTLFHPLPQCYSLTFYHDAHIGGALINNILASFTLQYRWMAFSPRTMAARSANVTSVTARKTKRLRWDSREARLQQKWSKYQPPQTVHGTKGRCNGCCR